MGAAAGLAAREEVERAAGLEAVGMEVGVMGGVGTVVVAMVAVREAPAAARAISEPARTCPDGSLPQTTRATAPDPAPATRTSVHRLRWRESSARYALTTRHRARECES